MKWGSIAIATVIFLSCGSARSDESSTEKNRAAARALYDEGRRQYDLNNYSAALEAFKQAYALYDDPAILHNIGQCYRGLGDEENAIKFYRSYLRRVPDAPNRDEVTHIITTLEQSLQQKRTKAEQERAQADALARQRAQADAAERAAKAAQLAAAAAAQQQELERQRATEAERHRPVYKRWWLWTTVGLVVTGGVAAGLAVAYTTPKNATAPGGIALSF